MIHKLLEALPDRACILLTTRHKQLGNKLNTKLQQIALSPLDVLQAIELLQEYIQNDVELPVTQLEKLATVLHGHPLALTIAIKRILEDQYPANILNYNVEEYQKGLPEGLKPAWLMLDPILDLTNRDENFELSLAYSYRHLQEDERIRFRTVGVLAYDQPFDLVLLASLWQVTSANDSEEIKKKVYGQVRQWVNRLCNLSLIEPASETELGDGWYRQHPLLHAYALALLKIYSLEYENTQSLYFDKVISIAMPFKELPPEKWKPLDPYLPHIFATGNYLVSEYSNWTYTEQYYSQIERARDFARSIYKYLALHLEVPRIDWLEMGLNSARQLQDQEREALFLGEIGSFYSNREEKQKGLRYSQEALYIYEILDKQKQEATILTNIGIIYRDLQEPEKALEFYEKALLIIRARGDQKAEAIVLNAIGVVYQDLKKPEKALEFYEKILPIRRAEGDRRGEATTLNNICGVYHALKVYDKALETAKEALLIYKQIGDQRGEAIASFNIGKIYQALGQLELAIDWIEKSITLKEITQNTNIEIDRQSLAKLRVQLAQQQKDIDSNNNPEK